VSPSSIFLRSSRESTVISTHGASADKASSEFSWKPLAIIIVGGGISSFVRTMCLKRIQHRIMNRLRQKLFSALLDPNRSIEFFDDRPLSLNGNLPSTASSTPTVSHSPSSLQNVLTTDVETVAKCLTTSISSTLRSLSSMTYSTILMYQTSPILLGISTSIVPLIGGTSILLHKYMKSLSLFQRSLEDVALSFAQERIQHIQTVKTSAREADEVKTFHQLCDQSMSVSNKIAWVNGLFMGGIFAMTSATLLSVFYVGGKAVSRGDLTQGKLTSFVTYSFLLGVGTSGFFKSLGEIHHGMTSAERIYRVIYDNEQDAEKAVTQSQLVRADAQAGSEKETIDSRTIETIADLKASRKGNIQLHDVSFAYANSPNKFVLRGCTLNVPSSTVVAVVGKNGAGKSTIVSLLSGLYTPQVGSVTLDGMPLSCIPRKDIAKLVSIVPQNPALFATTILENIQYSNPAASEEEVKEVTNLINAAPFIAKLEDGMSYNVGRDGCRLSGGQRQRIALARALLMKPSVLVLDEPTSQLDVEGESAVEDAIRACRASGTSLLLITHKEKTLSMADHVAVLQDGRVVETGTYEELKRKEGGALLNLMPDLE